MKRCIALLLVTLTALVSSCGASRRASVVLPEPIIYDQNKAAGDPRHIVYLARHGELGRAVASYHHYQKKTGRHNPALLRQLGIALLEMGSRSEDPETQLLSLFGAGISGDPALLDVLEAGAHSAYPTVQMASINFLQQYQDDRADDIILKGMSSDYLQIRFETAHILAVKRHPEATYQIEALMHKTPPQATFRLKCPVR